MVAGVVEGREAEGAAQAVAHEAQPRRGERGEDAAVLRVVPVLTSNVIAAEEGGALRRARGEVVMTGHWV